MADKEPVIVIKKITVQAAGAHGGSWKVAFADFMTALMAFFLLMWLLGSNEETKKNVSDHFSTPSIIEYEFSNYGAELTLEKLFLDLMNEPLKAFQAFMQPADYTPNFMNSGSKAIIQQVLADKLSDVSTQAPLVSSDEVVFEIEARALFKPGTAKVSALFLTTMDNINGFTAGLEDANIYLDVITPVETVPGSSASRAREVGENRIDIVSKNIRARLEHDTVDFHVKATQPQGQREKDGRPLQGKIRFRIKQKELLSDGSQPRKLGELFGKSDNDPDVYNSFVNKITSPDRKTIKED